MRKRNALIGVFVLALALTWPVYSLIRQAHRDAAYRTEMAPFQRNLHVGMTEKEVKLYLDSRQSSIIRSSSAAATVRPTRSGLEKKTVLSATGMCTLHWSLEMRAG
jgi:hypothetical protein